VAEGGVIARWLWMRLLRVGREGGWVDVGRDALLRRRERDKGACLLWWLWCPAKYSALDVLVV